MERVSFNLYLTNYRQKKVHKQYSGFGFISRQPIAPVGSLQLSILTLTVSPISYVGQKPTHTLQTKGGSRETLKDVRAKYKMSSKLQSKAPSSTLRTTNSRSGSGRVYEKRPPCISEHMKPTSRLNKREERDG
jgi:hypothetical protein